MLNLLRNDIVRENNNKCFSDLLMESMDTMEIRDVIMDDEEDIDDPELEKLIEEIPESDEDVTEDELYQLTESLIPDFTEGV